MAGVGGDEAEGGSSFGEDILGLVIAIVLHRHRNNGLLLSELGGYLLGPEHYRAGIKRISNLVHSQRWEARVIEEFLWQRGTQRVAELWEQGERPLAIGDDSVLEKPVSSPACSYSDKPTHIFIAVMPPNKNEGCIYSICVYNPDASPHHRIKRDIAACGSQPVSYMSVAENSHTSSFF